MEVKIKKLREDAIIPTRGSEQSAGYDLYACCDDIIIIDPHKTEKIGTGLTIQPPKGYFGAIFARSGLATQNGLRPANAVGICDQDYLGEYIVALHNDTDECQVVYSNDRIAQLIFLPYQDIIFDEVNEFENTERGTGGFGSTGVWFLTMQQINNNNQEIPKLLTPKQVSDVIGIGITNTYKLFKLKGFPKIQIGKKYFVNKEDLITFLSQHKYSSIFLN